MHIYTLSIDRNISEQIKEKITFFCFKNTAFQPKMRFFICFIDILKTFSGNPIALKSVKAAQKVKFGDDSAKWDHVWNLNSDLWVSIPIYSLLNLWILSTNSRIRRHKMDWIWIILSLSHIISHILSKSIKHPWPALDIQSLKMVLHTLNTRKPHNKGYVQWLITCI